MGTINRIGWRAGALMVLTGAVVLALAGSAAARTVWLCKPGQRPDPCTPGLATTIYTPTPHALRVVQPKAARSPKIDCFYVYPTVSGQKGPLANLHVDPRSARSRSTKRPVIRRSAACSRPCTGR